VAASFDSAGIIATLATDLAEVFAQASGVAQSPELGEKLTTICARARREHPSLTIDDRALVSTIARTTAGHPDRIDSCCAEDLALAICASKGDGAAIAELERLHDATISAVCYRFARGGHTVDDLRQILRAKLYVSEPGSLPRIADYDGQGTLANWLRVTAIRLFIDLTRRKDRAREALIVDQLPEVAAGFDIPLAAIKQEYRAAVSAALVQAVRELAPPDRVILRQHLAFHMSIDELGAALGIHRATAARRVARARTQLITNVRRIVAEKLALDATELVEVCELVISGLDLSLRDLLQTPTRG